jgi:ribokinase
MTGARRPRICVVGSANVDLTARVPRLPRLGETLVGRSFHLGFGGKGANQAVMAARLEAQATLVARVGRDAFGEGGLHNLQAEGVETAYVRPDAERFSGVAQILVDDSAQNVIVVSPGANLGLRPADVRDASAMIRAADIVIGQLEVPIETTLEAFRVARAARVRTVLNPAPAGALIQELLSAAELCVLNELEAEQLSGVPAATLLQIEEAARVLLARGPAVVIVTLGADGALVVEQESAEHVPAIRVDAIDPTGAGDAFIGSLAVFLAEGLPLHAAVRRANAVAALTVTRIGAQGSYPRRAEVDAFFARWRLE